MSATRRKPDEFHVGALLTVTDGRLLCPREGPRDNGIGELYRLLTHMTRGDVFTHQLPRVAEACKPWLLRQHPWLAGGEMQAEFGRLTLLIESAEETHKASPREVEYVVTGWLKQVAAKFGERHPVDPMPPGEDGRIDPVEELVGMVGREKVGVVEVQSPEDD